MEPVKVRDLRFKDKIIIRIERVDPDGAVNAVNIGCVRGAFVIKPKGFYELRHKLSKVVREWSKNKEE